MTQAKSLFCPSSDRSWLGGVGGGGGGLTGWVGGGGGPNELLQCRPTRRPCSISSLSVADTRWKDPWR